MIQRPLCRGMWRSVEVTVPACRSCGVEALDVALSHAWARCDSAGTWATRKSPVHASPCITFRGHVESAGLMATKSRRCGDVMGRAAEVIRRQLSTTRESRKHPARQFTMGSWSRSAETNVLKVSHAFQLGGMRYQTHEGRCIYKLIAYLEIWLAAGTTLQTGGSTRGLE